MARLPRDKREFNAVKREKFPWCADLSQNASKNAIHNRGKGVGFGVSARSRIFGGQPKPAHLRPFRIGDAVTRWKKGQNRFPVYKHRSGKCSYQADNGEGTVDVYKKRIHLPKIGWVGMREELRYTGEITK